MTSDEVAVELLPPHVFHDFRPMCLDGHVERYMMLMPEFDERIQHCDWS